MRISKEGGFYQLFWGKKDSNLAYFRNEWSQLIGNYNWYNFTFIEISAEKDEMVPGFEIDLMLLGVGIHIRWNFMSKWGTTEATKRIMKFDKEAWSTTVGSKGDGKVPFESVRCGEAYERENQRNP